MKNKIYFGNNIFEDNIKVTFDVKFGRLGEFIFKYILKGYVLDIDYEKLEFILKNRKQ